FCNERWHLTGSTWRSAYPDIHYVPCKSLCIRHRFLPENLPFWEIALAIFRGSYFQIHILHQRNRLLHGPAYKVWHKLIIASTADYDPDHIPFLPFRAHYWRLVNDFSLFKFFTGTIFEHFEHKS